MSGIKIPFILVYILVMLKRYLYSFILTRLYLVAYHVFFGRKMTVPLIFKNITLYDFLRFGQNVDDNSSSINPCIIEDKHSSICKPSSHFLIVNYIQARYVYSYNRINYTLAFLLYHLSQIKKTPNQSFGKVNHSAK